MLKSLRAGAAALALLSAAAPLAAHAQLAPIVSDSVPAGINIATATTTKAIAGTANKKTYVTFAFLWANGTDSVTVEYGTTVSTPCDTGATAVGGAIAMVAQAAFTAGNGTGAVLTIPAGKDLCLVTSAAVQLSGWLQSAQY